MKTITAHDVDEILKSVKREQAVLKLCREWYRTGSEIAKQSLWYEIGVMLENEPYPQEEKEDA